MSPWIAVDIGNSTIKLGVIEDDANQWRLMHEWETAEFDLSEIAGELPRESCRWRVASVHRGAEQELHQWQQASRSRDDYLALSYKDLPLEINVESPERVGMDRLIAAVAANERRDSNRAAIIVDAGTAITVDLVDADGVFQGGVILPGFRLSARALADGTDLLPNVDATFRTDAPAVIGKSTTAAIRSGLFWGGVGAIRELVARTTAELPASPQIFVTGGDAERLTGYLANDAQFVSDLVLPDRTRLPLRHFTMEERNSACVATRLTPPGRGAVAVISVEGANAVEYVGRHFVSAAGKPLGSFPLDRIIFGRWEQPDGNGEEIVVCRTSESRLEVNCHGGIAAARAIMKALAADGVVEQSAESWAASRVRDSIETEAWLALAGARTERTAAILLDQFRGALRDAIDVTIVDLTNGQSAAARQSMAILLERGDIGLHLTKPWRVVFAGPPNVGKSSLMNCLLGYQRSIVFDQPGTTRDLLSASTAVDGWSLELTDTAGLRESEDAIEVEGVSRATSFLAAADLAVLVFDATSDWDAQQSQLLAANPQALRVINKCDLRDASNAHTDFLATSALTDTGVPELMQQIVKRLVRYELAPGDAIPFTTRQVNAIESACRAIDDGQISVAIERLQELVAHDPPTNPRKKSFS